MGIERGKDSIEELGIIIKRKSRIEREKKDRTKNAKKKEGRFVLFNTTRSGVNVGLKYSWVGPRISDTQKRPILKKTPMTPLFFGKKKTNLKGKTRNCF